MADCDTNLSEGGTLFINVSIMYMAQGGGTPLYGLYRYVLRNRLGFLEVLDP